MFHSVLAFGSKLISDPLSKIYTNKSNPQYFSKIKKDFLKIMLGLQLIFYVIFLSYLRSLNETSRGCGMKFRIGFL